MEIYVVTSRFKDIDDWTAINIDSKAFTDYEECIKYVGSKLTREELEEHLRLRQHNLIRWYEFDSKNYEYRITVLNLD